MATEIGPTVATADRRPCSFPSLILLKPGSQKREKKHNKQTISPSTFANRIVLVSNVVPTAVLSWLDCNSTAARH